jgi:predicted secreted protein
VADLELGGVAGAPVALSIGGAPVTGYRWELTLPDGVTRVDDPSARADLTPGAGSGARIRVVAAEPGEYVVLARLVRPWEPDRPARELRIALHVA